MDPDILFELQGKPLYELLKIAKKKNHEFEDNDELARHLLNTLFLSKILVSIDQAELGLLDLEAFEELEDQDDDGQLENDDEGSREDIGNQALVDPADISFFEIPAQPFNTDYWENQVVRNEENFPSTSATVTYLPMDDNMDEDDATVAPAAKRNKIRDDDDDDEEEPEFIDVVTVDSEEPTPKTRSFSDFENGNF